MKKISAHISYAEAVRSQTATKHGIENKPNAVQLVAMKLVAEKVFEPLRIAACVALFISSFFRCPDLNRRIGGSATSSHCKGEAIDIDAQVFGGVSNAWIFNYIKDNLEFDQLIWEFGDDDEPAWVHVSFRKEGNRNQILKAYKSGGKTKYAVL